MVVAMFLNCIYLLFPFLCYFIYLVYSKVIFEREKLLFLDLAVFSSYYICSRFGNLSVMYSYIINLPLLIALYKKRIIPSLIISLCLSSLLSSIYSISYLFLLIQYSLVIIFCYLTKFKSINIFFIITTIFCVIISIMQPSIIICLKNLPYLILFLIVMYVVFYLIIRLYNIVENTVNMYYSIENLTKEKKLYESLFKITHEIKNPIAVCKGYLSMFDLKDEKKAKKYISIIDQEIDRTLILLKDFSDISKINIEKNVMDITMLMEDVCDEVALAFNSNIKFKYNIGEEEVMICGDYQRLKQVLLNTIKNAKEAIKKNGTIEVEGKKTNGFYVINIIDNGIGMDNETNKNIGTPFYTTKKEGTGLGVCLSKEIVERHNGSITYFSKLYKGTTVRIMLPIKNKASF